MTDAQTEPHEEVKFMAEIDPVELAAVMVEAMYGFTRGGLTARQQLDTLPRNVKDGWLRAARAGTKHIIEKMNQARRVQ